MKNSHALFCVAVLLVYAAVTVLAVSESRDPMLSCALCIVLPITALKKV